MRDNLVCEDGENKAVRSFLQMYGSNPTALVSKFVHHMKSLEWDSYPSWVDSHLNTKMTAGGAQDWIRHLIWLETKFNQQAHDDMLSALRAIVAVAEQEDSFSMQTIKDAANIAIKQATG